MSDSGNNSQDELSLSEFVTNFKPSFRRPEPDYPMYELLASGRRPESPVTNSTIIKGLNTRLSADQIRQLIPIKWPTIPVDEIPPADDGTPGGNGPPLGGGGPGGGGGGGGGGTPGGGCCDGSPGTGGGPTGGGTTSGCCGDVTPGTGQQSSLPSVGSPWCPGDNQIVQDHDNDPTPGNRGCCTLNPCSAPGDVGTLCGGTALWEFDSGFGEWQRLATQCCWTCTHADGTSEQAKVSADTALGCFGGGPYYCPTPG